MNIDESDYLHPNNLRLCCDKTQILRQNEVHTLIFVARALFFAWRKLIHFSLGTSVFHHCIKKITKTICHIEKISNFVLNCYTYI